jgi:hypothetical protein
MAYYSFGGWKDSLFGQSHIHGPEGVAFYTRAKVVTSRWPHVEGPTGLELPLPHRQLILAASPTPLRPVSSEMGEVEDEDTATWKARFASGLAATFFIHVVGVVGFLEFEGVGFQVVDRRASAYTAATSPALRAAGNARTASIRLLLITTVTPVGFQKSARAPDRQ